MKVIEKPILPYQEPSFLSAIRDKIDYVRLILVGARQLLLNVEDEESLARCHLRLLVDKMSRLFIYTDDKYFSVSFPFRVTVEESGEVSSIATYSDLVVDNRAISQSLSVINDAAFESDSSFIRYFLNQDESDRPDLHLLEEIFQFEPGYIRYDCDPTNEAGSLHPLHHLDINYSQYSSFKFGLSRTIERAYFEDIQNIRTECAFLRD